MQILNFDPNGSFGSRLGESLGTGLEKLAQNKVQELQKQNENLKYQQAISSIPGMKPEVAKLLAGISPEERKLLLPNLESLLGLYPNQQQAASGQPGQPSESPAPGQMAQAKPAAGAINNIFKSPQERQNLEKINLQKLQYAQPIFDKIETKARPARELQDNARKALSAIDKAISGPAGALTPKYLQSEEGQYLQSILNRIVVLNAQKGKGVPSLGRLKLEEGAKAQIWQKPKVIKKIMEDILGDPELLEDIAEGNASQDIQENIDNYDLTKLNSLLRKKTKENISQGQKERSAKFTKSSLPDASKYAEGAKAKNPVTGEVKYVVRNGAWENI